jgi:hypothetical protein
MPPKKKEQPKAGPKVAVDKTFGLKNVRHQHAYSRRSPSLTVKEK